MKKKNIKYTILKTSYALFQQYGYHNVSVLQICQACQISKPTFYKHLKSKENILNYYFKSIDTYIPDEWYRYTDVTNYWNHITKGFLYLIDHIQLVGIDLYTENFIVNLKNETQTLIEVRAFHDTICDLIEAGQQAGQILNPASSEELYQIAMRLLSGYGAYWCMIQGKNDLKDEFIQGLSASFFVNEEVCHD